MNNILSTSGSLAANFPLLPHLFQQLVPLARRHTSRSPPAKKRRRCSQRCRSLPGHAWRQRLPGAAVGPSWPCRPRMFFRSQVTAHFGQLTFKPVRASGHRFHCCQSFPLPNNISPDGLKMRHTLALHVALSPVHRCSFASFPCFLHYITQSSLLGSSQIIIRLVGGWFTCLGSSSPMLCSQSASTSSGAPSQTRPELMHPLGAVRRAIADRL